MIGAFNFTYSIDVQWVNRNLKLCLNLLHGGDLNVGCVVKGVSDL